MIPYFESTMKKSDTSFFIGIFQDDLEKSKWHYHNYYEISFITEGVGKRIVADSIEEFQPGDLVFLGKNLPHVWIADKEQGVWTKRNLEMVYLQFDSQVLHPHVLGLPEFSNLQRSIILSERGGQILGQTLNEVSALLLQMPYLKGVDRMLYLYKILDLIGGSANMNQLASLEYMKSRFSTPNRRIALIHEYLMKNYRNDISLTEIAGLVNLTEASLCRFFKENMGTTVFEYLNKIKTEFACKLLMDMDLNILDVCLDSGFNNLSHFNKQFKKHVGVTPKVYRSRYLQDLG